MLRASGTEAYNDWIYDLAASSGFKLNSVSTILFNNRNASSNSDVLKVIRNSEAIFFAGGDQSQYIDYWVGTEVQNILQTKSATVTIGGTSAGCAVLGNWIYTGAVGSITSSQALADPYHKYMTFTSALVKLPYLDSIITDTHFVTRDRMGRMLTFLARVLKDVASPAVSEARALGVDEHTALLLDPQTGVATAVGVGTAYLCSSNHQASVCATKTPLSFTDITCQRLDSKTQDTFSFASWKGQGVIYPQNIISGKLTNSPYGP